MRIPRKIKKAKKRKLSEWAKKWLDFAYEVEFETIPPRKMFEAYSGDVKLMSKEEINEMYGIKL